MAKGPASINLIKTNSNELANQVINWALTIGRLLIIVVELVALSAFIYRFILDNQLRDLNSKIIAEQAYLNTQQKQEATFRNLQNRLTLETSTVNQGKAKAKMVKDVIALATPGISFINFTYSKQQFIIQLNTTSVFPLSVFINSLKSYPLTDSISIDLINNHPDTATIEVDLTVNLKNGGGQL